MSQNSLTPTVHPTTKVRLSIGAVQLKTKPIRVTPNPRFDENFYFLRDDPKLDQLKAEVRFYLISINPIEDIHLILTLSPSLPANLA